MEFVGAEIGIGIRDCKNRAKTEAKELLDDFLSCSPLL
jgi:hypothetical protein